jgi:hypothetical protein
MQSNNNNINIQEKLRSAFKFWHEKTTKNKIIKAAIIKQKENKNKIKEEKVEDKKEENKIIKKKRRKYVEFDVDEYNEKKNKINNEENKNPKSLKELLNSMGKKTNNKNTEKKKGKKSDDPKDELFTIESRVTNALSSYIVDEEKRRTIGRIAEEHFDGKFKLGIQGILKRMSEDKSRFKTNYNYNELFGKIVFKEREKGWSYYGDYPNSNARQIYENKNLFEYDTNTTIIKNLDLTLTSDDCEEYEDNYKLIFEHYLNNKSIDSKNKIRFYWCFLIKVNDQSQFNITTESKCMTVNHGELSIINI